MNVQNKNLLENKMTSSADVIEQALQVAEKLHAVLENEYRALMDGDVFLINSLAAEKSTLLDTLAQLEPHLRVVYNTAEMQEEGDSVQQLLQLCSDLNSRNRSLVLIAIDQNRKTLSLLRSVLNLDKTSVYGANGVLSADKSKRYIGSA